MRAAFLKKELNLTRYIRRYDLNAILYLPPKGTKRSQGFLNLRHADKFHYCPKWKQRVSEMTPRVRGLYYYALKTLQKTLLIKRPAITVAPAFKLIADRIKALESGVGTADETMENFPPLEKLIRIPTSQTLQE